jgi:hypothetical protein
MPSPNLARDNFYNIVQQSYDEKSFRGDYSGSNLIYAGFAIQGSSESDRVWQIKKLTYSGANLVSVTWPEYNGKASTDYNFAWADRASYTYS